MDQSFTIRSITFIYNTDSVIFQFMQTQVTITHLSSAIFRPSSSEDESEDEMMALDLIFPLRDGGMRSGLDLEKKRKMQWDLNLYIQVKLAY